MVFGSLELNVTGNGPVNMTVELPNGLGVISGGVISTSPLVTEILADADVAGKKAASPAWLAVTLQVPAVAGAVTTPLALMVQAPAVTA